MNEQILKELIASADRAINEEDFDKILDFYSDDATLVVMPGKNVTGKEQIKKAFIAIAEHFNHSLEVSQGEMIVVEGGDTALVIAKTIVRANKKTDSPFVADRKATYIFRKYPENRWLCVVDNSYGTDLLSNVKNL